jgi:hypothetical protein
MRFTLAKESSERCLRAGEAPEVAGNRSDTLLCRPPAVHHSQILIAIRGRTFHRARLVLPIGIVDSTDKIIVLAQLVSAVTREPDQAIGIGIGERTQGHSFDDAEHACVHANCES